MNIDYSAIGNHIRQIRQEQGMTQLKLSELLEVTPEYISRVERATTKPSLTMLSKISGIFHVSAATLLEGSDAGSADYKLGEFAEVLKDMPPAKRKLLFEFAQLLNKAEL